MHLMIDTETLARNTNAPVIEIGIVQFNHKGIARMKGWHVLPNFDYSTPDVSTIAFWNRQTINMPLNMDAQEFDHVMEDIVGWLGLTEIEGVWANAPSFDLVILRNLAQQYHVEIPWYHKKERCCRTMFAIGEKLGIERLRTTNEHDAVEDARAQAQSIINIDRVLTRKGAGIL